MTITHKISIDLAERTCPAQVDAVQDDFGRALSLMLYTNGIPWPIPDGIGALIRYRKADGIGGEYDTLPDGTCAWSVQGNILTVSLAPQVLTAAGRTHLSVLLTDGSRCVSTFDILLNVQPGICTGITKSEKYVHVSGFLIAPEQAKVGQYLRVLQTDGRGRVTRLEAADAPERAGSELTAIGAKIISGEIGSIILLGDSITDGAGGSDYNGNFANAVSTNTKGYCWANAFKKYTGERYGTTVQNKGMYGTVMSVQKEEALNFVTEKDFVIWLTGTNDRWDSNGYKTNLRARLDEIRQKCAGMLVISNIPATAADENEKPVTMQKMDEIIMEELDGFVPHFSMYQAFVQYCDQHGIALANCFDDHVHPNNLGYYIMFKLLCQKLGLPLDPYTNYRYSGAWWDGTGEDNSGEEGGGSGDSGDSGDSGGSGDSGDSGDSGTDSGTLLLDSTDNYGQTPTDFVYLLDNIVPVVLMDGYDSSTKTTTVSGKKITKVTLDVRGTGNITFGTVDLNTIGSAPVYTQSVMLAADTTGFVDFALDMTVGAHETLAFQSMSDSGHLGFVCMSGDLFIWKSEDFAAGAKSTDLILYGKIYGTHADSGDSTEPCDCDENGTDILAYYTNSDNLTVEAAAPGVSPLVLMYDYDSENNTTAFSGKHISAIDLYVKTAGEITIGTVNLNTVGSSPAYYKLETFTVEAGNNLLPLHWDLGANETLGVMMPEDTGAPGFVGVTSPMRIWQDSEFQAGESATTLSLIGTVYVPSDTSDPGTIIHDSSDEYDNLDNPVALNAGVVPLVCMDGYDSSAKTTDYSGKTITKCRMYVATAGNITFGAVDLNTVGQSGIAFTGYKTVTVSETGWVDIWVNLDIGTNETLAMQSVSDTGKLMFNVRSGELRVWQASEFEAGATGTTIIMVGTVYGC